MRRACFILGVCLSEVRTHTSVDSACVLADIPLEEKEDSDNSGDTSGESLAEEFEDS